MVEILQSPDDVLAVRVSGSPQRHELEDLIDRMLAALEQREVTHVFAEVSGLTGMELDGMTEHLRRSAPIMRQLRKFGRIAVVADQSWVRLATRLESALLPHVSYAVYKPEARDEAWRWAVEGAASPSQGR